MRFDKYSIAQEIKDNLIANGYFRTTDIQYKTIPAIMNEEDVLAIAQTGTGKTAAFAIPIIARIHEENFGENRNKIKCLVMVPTRELAQQIGKVFSKLSAHTRATNFSVYGGVDSDPQISQIKGGVDILIATPGRMFELIRRGYIDISFVKTLVLDEADRMMDMGFIDDIVNVKKLLRHKHQTLFFSATINKHIKKTAYNLIRSEALRIQVSPEEFVSKNVTHYKVFVEMDDKRHLLVNFLKRNPESKVIVFVRTQIRADRVMAHLKKNDMDSVGLHGGLVQSDREMNLEQFRNQKQLTLIATDLSARGIDLPGITHVINYDVPDDPENYVHRIGRTGRGFAKGDAVTFVANEESEKLAAVEEFIQTVITEIKVDLTVPVATEKELEDMSISDLIEYEEKQVATAKSKKKSQQKSLQKKKR
jgi:ATP-dependent RNA helicase RhlE